MSSVKAKKSTISVRLADDFVRSIGRTLELGVPPLVDAADAVTAPHYLIGFLGPNTSKALHLGHLRNIIIGNALASAFVSAGASSESYSLVGDIGRNVCEAMAGYQLFHQDVDLQKVGIKQDHFVGICYNDYLRHSSQSLEKTSADADPCLREQTPIPDHADSLLQSWRTEDASTRELWQAFRAMVENGHNETLDKLGIIVNRCYYESDHVQHAIDLIQRGLNEGMLEQLEDGTVVYDTHREEFRKIVLQRSDGFPTEHGRVLAVFHRVFIDHEMGLVHIDWNGTEWEPAQTILKKFMSSLALIPPQSLHVPVFHGMVLLEGEKMSSSLNQSPVLVDDLLDRLWQSKEIACLAESADGLVAHQTIADIVLKGFFLCEPISKHITYTWERLMDQSVNRGWLLARAWCRANSPATDTADDPDLAPAYRLAVVQSQGFSRALTNVICRIQPESLIRYLIHFCDSYLAAAPSRRLNNVALTILEVALQSLGFKVSISDSYKSRAADSRYAVHSPGM